MVNGPANGHLAITMTNLTYTWLLNLERWSTRGTSSPNAFQVCVCIWNPITRITFLFTFILRLIHTICTCIFHCSLKRTSWISYHCKTDSLVMCSYFSPVQWTQYQLYKHYRSPSLELYHRHTCRHVQLFRSWMEIWDFHHQNWPWIAMWGLIKPIEIISDYFM